MTPNFTMLALVTDAFGGRGGIAQYNRDFLGALVAGRVLTSITVLPRHAPDRVAPPAEIKQVQPRPRRILYALTALRVVLCRPVDIVFCGHLYMAPLAVLIARLSGAKLIVQMHGIEAWQQPAALRRRAVEAADLVLCVSRYTRSAVLQWAAVAPERVLVLPNTVAARFTPGDGSVLRAAWGLDGKCVLLSVGRMSALERYKGHDRVIRAIRPLMKQGHDVVYVIIGEGDDRDRLRVLANEEGIAERVKFMGAVDPDVLRDAYRMADLFVMPSTGEGFGIAFLEAMACGTPALGLGVGGALDALGDGELGQLTSEADLATTLSRMLRDAKPDPRCLAAAVVRRFGREPFTASACAAVNRLREAA